MEDDKRSKAIQVISKDPNRLIKTNPLINARFDITAIQLKVFLKVIATIDQSMDEMPEISISLKEFQSFIGQGKAKNLVEYLDVELTKLRKKDIYYEDDRIKLQANFFSSIVYHKEERVFVFEFSKNLKPFLLQIKENFTVLDLRNLLYLDSIYAMRFYEFCKEFERFKTFEFDVDDLKEKFGLSDRYKNYFDFKLKVLHQARAELIENSELYFDFEEIKNGKKVVRLKFTIIKNSARLKRQTEEEQENPQIKEIYALVGEYVSEDTVKNWFTKFEYEQIKKGVVYSINENNQKRVKDMARYLQKMVATPDLFDPVEQKKVQQKEKQAKKQETEKREQEIRMKEQEFEAQKNAIRNSYIQAKSDLVYQMFSQDETLADQLLQALQAECESDSPRMIADLAWAKYSDLRSKGTTQEKILQAIQQAGFSFNSYVTEWIEPKIAHQLTALTQEYQSQADKIGVDLL